MYLTLVLLHLGTLLPCYFIGGYLLLRPKGTRMHRTLGKVYLGLILTTTFISLILPTKLHPPVFFGHFGSSHLFSLLTITMVFTGYIAARKRKIRLHRFVMFWLYAGGLLVNGLLTLKPGRLLHTWLLAEFDQEQFGILLVSLGEL